MDIFKDVIETNMAEQNGTLASNITRNRNIEVKNAFDNFDFDIRINSRRVRKSSDFSNHSSERLNYMKLNRERLLLKKEDKLYETEFRIREMQSSVFEANGMDVPELCPVTKKNYRKLENEIVKIKDEIQEITKILEDRSFSIKNHVSMEELMRVQKDFKEELEDKSFSIKNHVSMEELMRVQKDFKDELEDLDVLQVPLSPESCLERLLHDFKTKMIVDVKSNDHIENRKCNPSEVARLIQNNDYIEDKRKYLRKEVLTNRRDSKMAVANFKRGLVMDKERREAFKSDSTFDLKSLDRALPSVLNCSKNLSKMKRNLKIEEKVTKYMKEKRFLSRAASGPLLSETDTFGPLLSATAASGPLLSDTDATESLFGFSSLYEFPDTEWKNDYFFT